MLRRQSFSVAGVQVGCTSGHCGTLRARRQSEFYPIAARHAAKKDSAAARTFSRFITRNTTIITVSEVPANLAIMRSRLNRRLPWPNLPSMAIRSISSRYICFFSRFNSSAFSAVGRFGLPSGGPDNRIPLVLQY